MRRSLAAMTLVAIAVVGTPVPAGADESATQTAQELAAPIPAADAGSKLAGGVSLAGFAGLVVFGLRRRVRRSATA